MIAIYMKILNCHISGLIFFLITMSNKCTLYASSPLFSYFFRVKGTLHLIGNDCINFIFEKFRLRVNHRISNVVLRWSAKPPQSLVMFRCDTHIVKLSSTDINNSCSTAGHFSLELYQSIK